MRKAGKTVGVVAIDPSSPFTGGALLGDRIRMTQHYLDKGVFIRSMATGEVMVASPERPKMSQNCLMLLVAIMCLIETVGVGQTELDVMGATDTVLVTIVPEAGDGVQVMKAGLMEIADIFVVNKADRDGANRMQTELTLMLDLKYSSLPHPEPGQLFWRIPVLQAQALNNIGMDELFEALEKHHQYLGESGELQRRRKARRREELTFSCRI